MKPAPFRYERPSSIEEAINCVSNSDENIKFLAGGQSLAPMMNLRLVRVNALCDLTYISELQAVTETNKCVFFGSGVTHASIEDKNTPEPAAGLMREVASGIAYRAVRNCGTLGGSIAHADPAADWITAMTTMNATIHLAGKSGIRTVPMIEYMIGTYTTVMGSGEIITKIEVPKFSDDALWGYYKICRKVGEFADAMASVLIDSGKRYCRVVLGATAGAPVVLHETSKQLAENGPSAALSSLRAVLSKAFPARSAVHQQLDCAAVERAIMMAVEH